MIGSGKTLAYLLPLIENLYKLRELNNNNDINNNNEIINNSPKIIIMTPTTELASQTIKVIKAISSVLRFRSACITSESNIEEELIKINNNADIIVATPGRLLSLLKNKQITLINTKSMILDEADVLFMDETFPLQGIGSYIPENMNTTAIQFLFVTATLPQMIIKQITNEFPDVCLLTGPGLHRIPRTIDELLIDCSISNSKYHKNNANFKDKIIQKQYSDNIFENKRLALINVLNINILIKRTIIFCNTIDVKY